MYSTVNLSIRQRLRRRHGVRGKLLQFEAGVCGDGIVNYPQEQCDPPGKEKITLTCPENALNNNRICDIDM